MPTKSWFVNEVLKHEVVKRCSLPIPPA